MPQKRNPVSLEHSRAMLSTALGDAQSVQTVLHNTPFGDIVDTEDDLQSYLWRGYHRLAEVFELLEALLPSLEVNKPLLERRAFESFSTVTELADTLVRVSGISFRQAHGFISALVRRLMEEGKTLYSIGLSDLEELARTSHPDMIEPLRRLTDASIKLALDPHHFVEIRSVIGGPSPKEVSRMLQTRSAQATQETQWILNAQEKLLQAEQLLHTDIHQWG